MTALEEKSHNHQSHLPGMTSVCAQCQLHIFQSGPKWRTDRQSDRVTAHTYLKIKASKNTSNVCEIPHRFRLFGRLWLWIKFWSVHYHAAGVLGSPRHDGQVDTSLLVGSNCERTANRRESSVTLQHEAHTSRLPGSKVGEWEVNDKYLRKEPWRVDVRSLNNTLQY